MSIVMLDLYCKEIANAKSTMVLSGYNAKIQGLLKDGSISLGLFNGLRRDIRDRADWLNSRKGKR